MKKLAVFMLLVLCSTAQANRVVWVNDGGNGWEDGEGFTAADLTAIETALDDNVFPAEQYATGSDTLGIQEAIDACEAAGGGVVLFPAGEANIDASSLTSPVIHLAGVDNGSGTKIGVCSLHGNGMGSTNSGGAGVAASEIEITNFDDMTASGGRRVGIQMDGQGQTLSDFGIRIRSSAGGTGAGSLSTSDVAIFGNGARGFTMQNVLALNAAGSNTGTGIELTDSQKGQLLNIWVDDFENGLTLSNGTTGNSGLTLLGANLRSGVRGLYIEGDSTLANNGCGSVAIHGGTIEGNTTAGILWESDSQCSVSLHGVHLEQDSGYNLHIDAAGAQVHMFGGRLGGSNSGDVYSTTAQTSGVGPDTFYAVRFRNGTSISGGRTAIAVDPDDASGTMTGLTIVTSGVPTSFGESGTPACMILRDSDDGGNSACAVLNGTFSCEVDTNGVCGDAT